ncbi:MAG TPA: TonB-dependent receptor [Rhodanobacteraceae bacterium]
MKTRSIVVIIAAALAAPCLPPVASATTPTRADEPPAHTRGARQATPPQRPRQLGTVQVIGTTGYATRPDYDTHTASLGPLGTRTIKDTPMSITVLPEQLLVNQQIQTVNEALRDLPSVTIRDQQGLEVSRPQSRGFVGTIDQNTRIDGMNVIGTTAIPAENLSSIEVLNGVAGSLFGPETPAGVFNYVLKRPTAEPMARLIETYNSQSVFTEQIDAGGPLGHAKRFGYRLNAVYGSGEGYVDASRSHRTLLSGAFDYHINPSTTLETNFSHYDTNITGLPGSVVYFGKSGSTVLPRALDPTTRGLGQAGAGTDLRSDMALAKLKHDFGNGWTFVAGALYENAIRNLWGITNTFTNDLGNYTVTKNFNAIPRYAILSNTIQLNGHFTWLGTENDLSIGSNGFSDRRYSYRNSIAVPLGSGNIADPVLFRPVGTPATGGRYRSGTLREQSLIAGDTVHFNAQWAVQAVLSASYLRSMSFNKAGAATSAVSSDGQVSPTASVIFTPTTALTAYLTWAHSVEPGDEAPTGSANAHVFLSPYHDKEYETGVKYAVSDHLLLTTALFRMTRPLAQTVTASNVFQVVGTQRNWGAEFFAQGEVAPSLSILGGVTYLDPRVIGSLIPDGNRKLVVGVPHVKVDVSMDWHPLWLHGLAFTGAVHYQGRRAATNTNNSFAPAFATLDAGIRYTTPVGNHPLTLRAQVLNLTNRFYYAAIADGNIVGSPGSNTAYYGAPRTFMLSAELDL